MSERDCRNVRSRLLQLTLADPEASASGLPEHLSQCAACRLYSAGVSDLPGLFQKGDYGPGLRHRTLLAVEQSFEGPRLPLPWTILPPALLATAQGLAAPLGCLVLLSGAVTPPALSWAAGLFIVHSVGFITASGMVLLLLTRTRTEQTGGKS